MATCDHVINIPLLHSVLLTGNPASGAHTWKTELLPKWKACSFLRVMHCQKEWAAYINRHFIRPYGTKLWRAWGEVTGDVKIHLLPSASVYLFEQLWGCSGCSEECGRYSLDPLNLTLQDKWTLSVLSPPPSKWTWHTQLWDKSTKRWKMKSRSLPVFSMFIPGFSGKREDCFTLFMNSSCASL